MLKKWWSVFFVIPVLSLIVFIFLYFALYPLLTYDTFKIQLDSILVIKICAMIGAFVIPLMMMKIYKIKIWVPLVIWCSLSFLGLYTGELQSFNGNQNSAWAGWFLGFQLAAILMTAIYLAKRAYSLKVQ